ncbi:hypothetical protein ACO1O0_007575 [Amphichorda felina]
MLHFIAYSFLGALATFGFYSQAYELPHPTGPYNVGARRFIQPFFQNHTGYHHKWLSNETYEYMVTLYYPTLDESVPQPYLEPGLIDILERDIAIPKDTLRQFMGHRVWNASFLDVQEAPGPTVFFDGRIRFPPSDGNSILLSELASHGYTIAAIDHPYEQLYLKYPNGTEVVNPLGHTCRARDHDIHFGYFYTALRRGNVTLDLLDRWPQLVDGWKAPFAKGNIGLLGVEMGASSMVDVANHTSVGAVCALGLQQPFGHMSMRQGFHWLSNIRDDKFFKIEKGLEFWGIDRKCPGMHLGGRRDNSRFYWMKPLFPKAWWRWLVVKDAEQLDFTDWTIWKVFNHKHLENWQVLANTMLFERHNVVGKINGERMVNVTNHIVRAFFDRHLRPSVPYERILEDPDPEYPEVEVMRGSFMHKDLGKVRSGGSAVEYLND